METFKIVFTNYDTDMRSLAFIKPYANDKNLYVIKEDLKT